MFFVLLFLIFNVYALNICVKIGAYQALRFIVLQYVSCNKSEYGNSSLDRLILLPLYVSVYLYIFIYIFCICCFCNGYGTVCNLC